MNEQKLIEKLDLLMAELTQLRQKVACLEAQLAVLVQPVPPTVPPVTNTTRRQALTKLAKGLVAGVALGTAMTALPQQAQARVIANPTGPNVGGRIGAIILPVGSTVGAGAPGGTTSKYGVVATSEANLDLTTTPVNSAGVVGQGGFYGVFGAGTTQGVTGVGTGPGENSPTGVYGFGDTFGMHGFSVSGTGIYGQSDSGLAVYANGGSGKAIYAISIKTTVETTSTDGYGVNAYSSYNAGLFAGSLTGPALYLSPNSQPSTNVSKGAMYVDYTNGNLHIYNGTEWRTVVTTAG